MSRIITSLKVRAHLKDLYTCRACGRLEYGTTYLWESNAGLPDLEKSPCAPRDMPEGWASFYGKERDVFQCRTCNEKEKT